MTRRKLPVIVVSVAGLVAFFILCVVYGTGEGSWSTIFPSLSSHQESNVGGGVVLLTAVTYERLGVFAAVDDFYTKLWRNRLGYAKTHGIYPFTTFYIVGYDNLLIDLNKFPIARTQHPVWGKLPSIMEAFEKYPSREWVWWLDVDAIIMTPHLDLYDFLLKPEAMRARLIAGDVIKPTDDVGVNHGSLETGEVDTILKAFR